MENKENYSPLEVAKMIKDHKSLSSKLESAMIENPEHLSKEETRRQVNEIIKYYVNLLDKYENKIPKNIRSQFLESLDLELQIKEKIKFYEEFYNKV